MSMGASTVFFKLLASVVIYDIINTYRKMSFTSNERVIVNYKLVMGFYYYVMIRYKR